MNPRTQGTTRLLWFTAFVLAIMTVSAAFPRTFTFHWKPQLASTTDGMVAVSHTEPPLLAAQVQAQPLPPILLNTEPEEGASWSGQPVVMTFDQPLPESFAGAFTIEPSISGSISTDGAVLTFVPDTTPEAGVRYRVSITTQQDVQPASFTLVGAYPLAVAATQPSQGAAEVSTSSQIVVVFNRPVVPLTGIDAQVGLPQPLTLEPAVEGTGQWVNTSVYAFRPKTGLAGATDYTVTVDDISTPAGESLGESYVFTFTTASPIVLSASPTGDQIRPETVIQVDFSQQMDRASTESAFSLRPQDTGTMPPVAGAFEWDPAFASLVFTPTSRLEYGKTYTVRVGEEAKPASGKGRLREAYTTSFTVVPYPAVAGVSPVDGAKEVPPDTSVTIRFNTLVSQTLALDSIKISPILTSTHVYSYYSYYDNTVELSWFKEPRTRYTVTIESDIADLYGNTLDKDLSFSFVTGDYAPFARLELERFTHFSADTPPRAGILFRNVDTVAVDLYRLSEEELFELTGSNEWDVWQSYQPEEPSATRIWRREYDTSGNANITVRQIITLTDASGNTLPPGGYFLHVEQPEGFASSFDDKSQAAVLLSNSNLLVKKSERGPSLAWLTDLATGAPVPGASIRFYVDGEYLGEGVTDDSGIVTARLEIPPERSWAPLVAVSGEAGADSFAYVSSNWSSGIAPWEFNISGGWGTNPLQGYVYTDRPIYRPGHTVYWKGIVRELVDDDYQLPPDGLPLRVSIRDDMGVPIFEDQFELGEHGTVHGELHLSPEARTGYYYIEATTGSDDSIQYLSGQSFQVAAYRTPEFEISVSPLQEQYYQGDTVQVRVKAAYFSGGPLANAPVTWRLISDPYYFSWTDPDEERYFSFTPYDPEQEEYDPYVGSFNLGLVQEGTGQTDASGEFTIELPADISRSLQSQNWTFDVTVESASGQFVSGRTSVPVHRAGFYIGLAPRTYLASAGDLVQTDVIAVTPEMERYPGADIDAVVYEFRWNSVYEQAADGSYRWSTSVERTPVFSTTLTTGRQGDALIEWTPAKGGQFQIAVSGEDEDGNPTSSSAFIWISAGIDDEFVAWPRENNDRIELVSDKKAYAPGDTAQILIPSPFTSPVQALITIERSGVLESKVITLTGNSESLEIPITGRHIPNIYVGVVLAKGIDETNPTPALRVGYIKLPVDTNERVLDIVVEPSAETVRPSDTVTYTLTVRDSNGDPVPNAEVSAALVDKAILSLAAGYEQRLVDVFYYERPLDVTTGALLIINQDRVSQQLSEGAKGGGGGGGGEGLEVRENFADAAFWRADLLTDEDGEIHFSVKLPDNLTSWRLAAKAVTDSTQVGEAFHDIIATKELQIRPITPRFFTAGDRAYVGAAVINTSSESIENGTIRFSVEGAGLIGSVVNNVDLELDGPLGAGEQVVHTWPVEVTEASGPVTVTIEASGTVPGGALADAVRLSIPVNRYQSPETVSTSGSVPPEGATEVIYLPAAATDAGELAVTVEPSLASGMLEGLSYLAHYPYECNEQTVSRFLPNLMTLRVFGTLGVEDPELEKQLAYQIGIATQRLVSRQNQDGGWGYWPGGESAPFISAYVLWGMSSADSMGYAVPEMALTNAATYLEQRFEAPSGVTSEWQLNEMAFMHYVLSTINQGDPGRASTLYDVRERLGIYGKAFLAMALANMEPDGEAAPRVRTLLDDIAGEAQISATGVSWAETSIDFRTLNTDTRTTSIVLAAFARLMPDHPLLPQVVRWLMLTREAGRWATTQENAWAIIALTDWLDVSGELEGEYEWQTTLNGAVIGQGEVTPQDLGEPAEMRVAVAEMLRDQANTLHFSRTTDLGAMYYTADLRYYLDATAIESRDRGIVVDRSFALAGSDSSEAVNSAHVGDVISVTVTIVAPTDLHHVLVEVPVPAGFETIDPRLATTSQQFDMPSVTDVEAQGDDKWWWSRWIPSYTDIRDDKVAVFATFLPAGAYQYTFNARAGIVGEYRVLPAYAEMMYYNDVWGRSSGALFTVTE